MNVYELDYERDEQGLKRYQELIISDLETSNKLEEYESCYGWLNNHQPIREDWFPVRVEEAEYTHSNIPGDYPLIHGYAGFCITPIFSQRAVEALADLLEGNGELLPLLSDMGQYYAFNITREVEALDDEKSEFKPLSELDPDLLAISPDIPDILCISHYEFYSDRIASTSIFKLPKRYNAERPLITDRFVQRVQEADLKGFAFNRLWTDQPITATV
jgi:hypothetical protein